MCHVVSRCNVVGDAPGGDMGPGGEGGVPAQQQAAHTPGAARARREAR